MWQFVKNRSFTKFWFVGSKNWIVIRKSWTLIPTLLLHSEIAKMEFSIFWIWRYLRLFWKFTFFKEIRDLRSNFKFEEIWGDLRRRGNPDYRYIFFIKFNYLIGPNILQLQVSNYCFAPPKLRKWILVIATVKL